MKALIVEDEAIIAMNLEIIVKTLGEYETKIVPSGEKALNVVETWGPDLIFMDIELAGEMDGINTASEINKISSTPIVYTTSYGDKETLDRASKTKYVDYLLKPVSRDAVMGTLAKVS